MIFFRRWPGKAIILALLIVIAVSHGTRIGLTQVTQPTQPAPIDLSGKWELDLGGTVQIDHLQSTGSVFARFSPSLKCHDDMRTTLLNSLLRVTPVSGGPPKMTLADGTFFACTRDKKLIDSCSGVTAVWKSKFRNATVSPDGETITGERFYEWLAYDGEENGRYVNCRRDPSKDFWGEFTLTRACEPNKADQCRALSRAMRSLSPLLDTRLHSPSPSEWKQWVGQARASITAELNKVRKEFCDDKETQAKIDEMLAILQVIGTGSAQTPSAVVAERMMAARIDLDLKSIATTACAVSGPAAPPPAGICGGTPPKDPADNQAIDQVRKQIDDGIKEALKMIQDYEREAQGGANTTAGQYADYWRGRLAQLKKLKGYWDMIRAASCIPPELAQLLRAMLAGRTDMCTDVCYETAKWIEKWYPGPNGDIQKKTFLELCGFNCP